MGVRDFNFTVGATQAALPAASTPTVDEDLTTKLYVDTNFAGKVSVVGTEGTPIVVTAAGGITGPALGENDSLHFLKSDGGAIDISASPQITAGTVIGQRLSLMGTSATLTIKLDDGTGLTLNGSIILALENSIELQWTGTVWRERSRSN